MLSGHEIDSRRLFKRRVFGGENSLQSKGGRMLTEKELENIKRHLANIDTAVQLIGETLKETTHYSTRKNLNEAMLPLLNAKNDLREYKEQEE